MPGWKYCELRSDGNEYLQVETMQQISEIVARANSVSYGMFGGVAAFIESFHDDGALPLEHSLAGSVHSRCCSCSELHIHWSRMATHLLQSF